MFTAGSPGGIQNSDSRGSEQGLGLCYPPIQEVFYSQCQHPIIYTEDLGPVTKM